MGVGHDLDPLDRLPLGTLASIVNHEPFYCLERKALSTSRCCDSHKESFAASPLFRPFTTTASVRNFTRSNTESLGEIVRHGKGDAYITLSVSGTEFHTLRSTINSNAVMADHVARAEANAEITHKGAVFIDRDPAQFGIILQYLRNSVESLNNSSSHGVFVANKTQTYLQLPRTSKN